MFLFWGDVRRVRGGGMILYHVFPCGCKDEFVCWAARDSDLQGVREDVGLHQVTQTASLLAAHAVNTDQCIFNADFAVIEKDLNH